MVWCCVLENIQLFWYYHCKLNHLFPTNCCYVNIRWCQLDSGNLQWTFKIVFLDILWSKSITFWFSKTHWKIWHQYEIKMVVTVEKYELSFCFDCKFSSTFHKRHLTDICLTPVKFVAPVQAGKPCHHSSTKLQTEQRSFSQIQWK